MHGELKTTIEIRYQKSQSYPNLLHSFLVFASSLCLISIYFQNSICSRIGTLVAMKLLLEENLYKHKAWVESFQTNIVKFIFSILIKSLSYPNYNLKNEKGHFRICSHFLFLLINRNVKHYGNFAGSYISLIFPIHKAADEYKHVNRMPHISESDGVDRLPCRVDSLSRDWHVFQEWSKLNPHSSL